MLPEDGSPAPLEENVAPIVETPTDYSSPDDIEYELTAEQEQEYVNQILKEGHYTAPTQEVAEPAVEGPVAEKPVAPVTAPVVEPPKPTDQEQQELTTPQSDDLWIEVDQLVLNDLGEETTQTVKLIYDPADPSSFIPDDFTAKSTKQLAEIMEAKAEMAKIYGDREKEYTNTLNQKDEEAQSQARIDAWNVEIQSLVEAGVIPSEADDATGYTEKTDAVYEFMAAENTKRAEDGRPLITTFGTAHAMYENSEAVKAAKEAEKQEIIDTKQKGGMIGGGSASSGGAPQKAAYVAGSAKNIWDIQIE